MKTIRPGYDRDWKARWPGLSGTTRSHGAGVFPEEGTFVFSRREGHLTCDPNNSESEMAIGVPGSWETHPCGIDLQL